MSNTVHILPDKPKEFLSEDALHRESLVNMIVASILSNSLEKHPSICYGVYGQWGEGKTSLLNFVKSELLKNGKKDKINIVQFNPWIVSNEESLLKEFFNSIISKTTDKKLRDLLSKYGGLITFASKHVLNAILPGAGCAVEGFLSDAQNALGNGDDSIIKTKDSVSKAIEKSGKHLLVFVDDIDRLDSEEVHTLFRLIRQVADFPNTIYVLAMDPAIVSKSLKSYVGDDILDGRAFIEKIVQVPIQLPQIPKSIIVNILCVGLSNLFEKENCIDKVDIDKLCEILSGVITTPRQVIRYMNQLAFVLPKLKAEVNLYDLCCVEAVKVINVSAYLSIYNHRSELLKETDMSMHFNKETDAKIYVDKIYEDALTEILGQVPVGIRSGIDSIMSSLFDSVIVDNIAIIDEKRLRSTIYFPLYFIQYVPEWMMSGKEIDSFVDSISIESNDELTARMDSILGKYGWDTLVRLMWQSVRRYKNYQLDCVSKLCVALSTSTAAQNYPPYSAMGRTDTFCFVLLQKYMSGSSNYGVEEAVDYAAKTLTDIYSTAELNYCMCLNAAVSQEYNHRMDLKPLHAKPLIDRFLKEPYSRQMEFSQFLLSSIYQAMKSIDEKSPIEYLDKALDSDEFIPNRLLYKFIPTNGEIHINEFIKIFNNRNVLAKFIKRVDKKGMTDEENKSLNKLAMNYDLTLKQYGEIGL